MDMYFFSVPVAEKKKKNLCVKKKMVQKFVRLLPNCVTIQWGIVL